MTSMIDVMFILLFFFMLSTSFVRSESMELSLPSSKAPPAKPQNDGIVHLLIDNEGAYYIGKTIVQEDALQAELAKIFGADPERKVMLWTAGNVPVQSVVMVMDKVYLSGGKKISVAEWNQMPGAQ